MDPQSQAFTPYSTNSDTWKLQTDVVRVQQVQADHGERIARLERRQDEEARVKSVWGSGSPFPSVLSGTPQQVPLQQPPSDQFRGFDDEATTLMSSLHLDAEDEPRRGLGAASRANSVRFDESANQNHFSHSSRPSMDFMSRTSSGLGGLQMGERTTSHKSEGRASSVHSLRSAASGRANSMLGESSFSLTGSNQSPVDAPGVTPGLLLLGSVPAIIRCWMNTNFKHDALLYAAVCSGSYKSHLYLPLIQKLGFEHRITVSSDDVRTIQLPVYFPEATLHPASSRSSSPAPQLPALTITFSVVDNAMEHDSEAIQVIIGSDVLRAHNADILFSSNSMTMFDDDRSKLSIPLVRPEDEAVFKKLYVSSGEPQLQSAPSRPVEQLKEQSYLSGLGHNSPSGPASSATASPPPGKYRPPGAIAAEFSTGESAKAGVSGLEFDARSTSRSSTLSRPSLTLINTSADTQEQLNDASVQNTSSRTSSTPAIWGNWRKDGNTTPAAVASASSATTASNALDWANAGRSREAAYQRKESGIKVLKPKSATRTVSTTLSGPVIAAASPSADGSNGKSRFFDEGRRRSGPDSVLGKSATTAATGDGKKENQVPGTPTIAPVLVKTKTNPVGGASAFSWLNTGAGANSPTITTASSSLKKRRLAPFIHDTFDSEEAQFDHQGLQAHHATSSPSSSPQPFHHSDAPSPVSSQTTTRHTSPHSALPPHIHEEVLMSQEGSGGLTGRSSPSEQMAGISLGGESMFGSENGATTMGRKRTGSPGQSVLGARSVSPAKRSAADMDGEDELEVHQLEAAPRSFEKKQVDGPPEYEQALDGMRSQDTSMDVTEDIAVPSTEGTQTANSSATSFSEDPPPYTETSDHPLKPEPEYTTEELDEQVSRVMRAVQQGSLDLGDKGVVVSKVWLSRVLSRTSEGLKSGDFPKEARQGAIGPVDNLSVVPEGGFDSEISDGRGSTFIPLKAGLQLGEDIEILPKEVWGVVVGSYGMAPGQHQISRYAVDTSPPESVQQNIQYELYPPTITLRKVPKSTSSKRSPTPRNSMEKIRLMQAQRARGQSSDDDAIKLVASRSDRFQKFLERSKAVSDIRPTTKVKLWRLLNPHNVVVDRLDAAQTAALSPTASCAASPSKAAMFNDSTLVLPSSEFKNMGVGKDIEYIDAKDETNNSNYNGKSTLETFGIFEDQTIILEEQIDGPAGGAFASDLKKRLNKPSLTLGKQEDSRAGSTTTSGRTSPAPGSMLTRGRARRDGRTRGVAGLTNLGNTCYMNSALQCIRSVEELAIYFLMNKYKHEINANNPLGHKGAMAKVYAGVLSGIYGDNAGGSFSPSDFKRTLGRIQPMFSGYGQQDSQEFLSFLVDALHEDLNRIEKKPYIENPDSDDARVRDQEYVEELGKIYRLNHQKRNESVCMDLFSGFYKNTMECPVCDKVSVTFDPYSLLTVQIPHENNFSHPITFVPRRGRPINHQLDIEKNATWRTVKEKVASKHPGVLADHLWVAEVYNQKIYKVYADDRETLVEAGINNKDYIYFFELDAVPTNFTRRFESSPRALGISMESRKADCMSVPIFSRQHNRFGNWDMTLHPLYISLTREEAQDFEIILKKVLIAVAQQTSRPILTENGYELEDDDKTSSRVEKDEAAIEDGAQVSDSSVPSEDGYVEVSISKSVESGKSDAGIEAINGQIKGNPIPKHFMDPQYHIPEALRNGLFGLNYGQSDGGLNCASLASISSGSVRNMCERVKQPVRRASSSSVSDESTTSAATGQVSEESEESDADDDEGPDLVLGGEQPLQASTPDSGHVESGEDLPDEPIERFNRRGGGKHGGRHGGKRRGNKRDRKLKTYSHKERQANRGGRGSGDSQPSQQSPRVNGNTDDDDNQFYIKLGEGIVLDWHADGLDGLFGGKKDDPEELRGHWLSSSTCELDFIHDPELAAKQERRKARKSHGVTLEDCFQETGKREILSEDNAWYCNRCKEMRQAAKTLEIWTAPEILIVHLKRFGGSRMARDKIDVLVDYPIEGLDLTKKIGSKEDGKEYLYDLFAVDNHFGGLGGGHYTAIAKNFYDKEWYDYNGEYRYVSLWLCSANEFTDSMCSKIGRDAKLHSAAAYLLFYRRRSDKPLGPQYLQDLVTEFRNPTETETTDDIDGEESGEGRLGGPTSSLHGSSSGLVAAGADTNGSPRSTRNGLSGVGSTLTRTQSQNEESPLGLLNGKAISGPVRPAHLQYGSQGNTGSWGFDGLEAGRGVALQPSIDHEADEEPTDNLMRAVGDDHYDAADNDSTAAGLPSDAGSDSRLLDDFDDEGAFLPAYDMPRRNDVGMLFGEEDYGAFQDERSPDSGALHREDVEMEGSVEEIHLAPALTMEDNDLDEKMALDPALVAVDGATETSGRHEKAD
ncbi:hypothetical protein LTR62_002904 [Meristemomyces frigidus]|uniref:ubiquitinyl hydrolase 1 n=1 Tax=Meristemomyces frigidus TaxID=1508187 RepID=A0AAN7TPZ4_9PEZI|nr:hypothetical protein LTR62_002904 [Meristemomyces frigidus]